MAKDFRGRKRSNDPEQLGRSRPLIYALNRLLITLSNALIVSLALILIGQSFTLDAEIGIRSLAAAALPAIIITYLAFFTRSFTPPTDVSPVGCFLIAAIWMITLLILINILNTYAYSYGLPTGVFLLSTTFSLLIFLTRNISFPSILSTSYGIVSGLLIYTLIFGVPFLGT
jgi:hypothetical protein